MGYADEPRFGSRNRRFRSMLSECGTLRTLRPPSHAAARRLRCVSAARARGRVRDLVVGEDLLGGRAAEPTTGSSSSAWSAAAPRTEQRRVGDELLDRHLGVQRARDRDREVVGAVADQPLAVAVALTSTALSRGSAGTRSSLGRIADAMRSGSPEIAARRIGRSASSVTHAQERLEVERARDDRVDDLVDHRPHRVLAGRDVERLRCIRSPTGSIRPHGCRSSRRSRRSGRADASRTRTSRRRRLRAGRPHRAAAAVTSSPVSRSHASSRNVKWLRPAARELDRRPSSLREAVVGDLHLVTQADDRLVEMAAERGADPAFGIGEVDEERVGREPLDVARDRGDERNRPQRVREAARPAVLAVDVIDAVPARDLEVEQPAVDAIDLDRHDDRVGARQRVDAIGVALDGDAARRSPPRARPRAAPCVPAARARGRRGARSAPANTGSA